jgi:hypothetical protein
MHINFLEIIQNCEQSIEYFIESDQSLEIDECEPESETLTFEEESEESETPTGESSQGESLPSSPEKRPKTMITFEDKKKAVEFWNSGKNKKKSVATVSNRFRYIKSKQQLYEFEKQIEQGGSRNDKLNEIWLFTFQEFKKAKDMKLIVHDNDLQRWAMKKKFELQLENFTASHNWLWKFRSHYRIVSRKITKFVTSRYSKEKIDIIESADLFVNSAKLFLRNFSNENIYNTDQSSFSKEMHSGRTFDFQGVKNVEAIVQSISATTHSYTIQPIISKSGKLLSPLFIVLQEPSGQFGPRVHKELFSAPNIYVTASKSGKLSKDHLKIWFKEVFFPNVGDKSVLFLDSWTTYNDKTMIKSVTPSNKTLEILTIPPKATSLVQPLDKYGFRLWKNFVRKFSDRVVLDGLDVDLFHRNNILKLQSLVHNQLSSPRFENVFKYSWYACGYSDDRPGNFVTPVEFCFDILDKNCSRVDLFCNSVSFIVCSWCNNSFCFDHFFNNFHYCINFQ